MKAFLLSLCMFFSLSVASQEVVKLQMYIMVIDSDSTYSEERIVYIGEQEDLLCFHIGYMICFHDTKVSYKDTISGVTEIRATGLSGLNELYSIHYFISTRYRYLAK
jgi:hypothetical protein